MVFIPALLRNVEIETVKLTLHSLWFNFNLTLIQKKTFRLGMQNKTLSSNQWLNIRRVSGHQQSSEIPEESVWECWTLRECLKDTLSQNTVFPLFGFEPGPHELNSTTLFSQTMKIWIGCKLFNKVTKIASKNFFIKFSSLVFGNIVRVKYLRLYSNKLYCL